MNALFQRLKGQKGKQSWTSALSDEGGSASHLISSSDPHSAHFLVRATSKCSSFHFSFLNVL